MKSPDGASRALRVEAAGPRELIGIRWLLNVESVPTRDLTEAGPQHFLVIRDEIDVVEVVGHEVDGHVALRSLVVANSHAGQGIGRETLASIDSLRLKERMDAIGRTDDKQQS